MIKHVVPALLSLLAAGPMTAVAASERDHHFATMQQLIDQEFHLVAKRQLDAYRAANYDDPGGHRYDVLQWLFYDTFSLGVPGEEGKRYASEAQRLADKLAGVRSKLDPALAEVFQVSGKVQRIATKLSRDLLKPDAAPPLVGYTADEISSMQSLVKLLIETADATMSEQLKAIEAYQPTYEKTFSMGTGQEFWDLTQRATMLRFDHANTFYQAYKPLREIVVRRDNLVKAGLPSEFIDEVVDKWLDEKTQALAETYTDWDWTFGDYYIYLRHRLAVLLSEYVRQVKVKGREKAVASYDDVQNMFFAGIQVDPSTFDREMRDSIVKFKYEIWSDLLYWHLAMGDAAALRQGTGLWKTFTELSADDRKLALDSSDHYRNVMAGHLYMLRARIARRAGDSTTANSLMSEVQAKQNFFQGNAKGWIAYWVGGGGGAEGEGDPWANQPRAMEPDKAITLARALISQATKVIEVEQSENFYTQAAVALRDGILGLPADTLDPVFVEHAPGLYQSLGYALYKRGWYYQAATVVHEGLQRFQPELWGKNPSNKNPWFLGGKVTPPGALVKRLANDALAYSQALYARTRSDSTNALLEQAIERMRAYDPDSVEENADRMQIVLLIQQGDYQRAHDKAIGYYNKMKELGNSAQGVKKLEALVEALWGLRMATRATYQLWDEQVEQGVPEAQVAEVSARLEELTGQLTKMVELRDKVPEKFRSDFDKANQEVLNFQIAKMFKEEQYSAVVELLGEAFWEDAPTDESLARGFMGYLAGAAFKMNKSEATRIQEAAGKTGGDPAQVAALIDDTMASLLGQWGHYAHARSTFNQVMRQFPALELQAVSMRKQLAQVYNLSGILVEKLVVPNVAKLGDAGNGALRRWLETAVPEGSADLGAWLKSVSPAAFKAADADADGRLADAELDSARSATAVAEALSRESKSHFADLYEPIIDPDEKDTTVLAVANTLWDLDQKARAAKLYENYKGRLMKRPELRSFLADPLAAAAEVAEVVTGRADLKPYWEAGKRGMIPDLLHDQPGFLDQYYNNPTTRSEDWPEDKASPFAAQRKLDEFRKQYDQVAGLLANAEEGRAALDGFQKKIEDWAYSIIIDTRLIEAYRESGQLKKAVDLAKQLYAWDPRDPTFMAVVVDGTLEAAKNQGVDRAEIEEAREIAAALRSDSKRAGDLFNYWLAYIQVLELSQLMGDIAVINRVLTGFNTRNTFPSDDLFKPVEPDFELGQVPAGYGVLKKTVPVMVDGEMGQERRFVGTLDRSAMQVLGRFKALYEVDGVQVADPITVTRQIVTDADEQNQTIHVIEYNVADEQE